MREEDVTTSATVTEARHLAGIALVSATLLMTELALTRIFSVIMYYHFAFLVISIALFGLSASGVFAYVARGWLNRYSIDRLLAVESLLYTLATIVAGEVTYEHGETVGPLPGRLVRGPQPSPAPGGVR